MAVALVPLHSGFDRLKVPRKQLGQGGSVEQNDDAARNAWLARDKPGLLKGEHHLMDARGREAEEPHHVCLRRRASVHQSIGVNKR
jgi:hypothetical protein